ncbi:hypothetical protein L2E82_08527 [Cichorium intybus]|uniref:Uncharacterized protein n=1 Tax=Cichorium intybus TaxID=13427 RepID=A0ACB9G7Q4_CICIN|nr:hypothetical protein L2E82_08527 [Cichorium intybus]
MASYQNPNRLLNHSRLHPPSSKKSTKSRTEVSMEEDEYPESDLSTPEDVAMDDFASLTPAAHIDLLKGMEMMESPLHFDPDLASSVISQIDRSLMECPMPSRIPTTVVSGKTLMSDSIQPLHHDSTPYNT